jgi:uncharacterized protein YijF (DUF1287 family)
VKKQKKPRSQPQKRKARSAPLPLDTSRRHHPTAQKTASPSSRISARRSRSSAPPSFGVLTGLGRLWGRLAATSHSDRADAAMLALPVLLIAMTIAVGRWTNASAPSRQFATTTAHGTRALNGLPPVATSVTPRSPAALPAKEADLIAPLIEPSLAADIMQVAGAELEPEVHEPTTPPRDLVPPAGFNSAAVMTTNGPAPETVRAAHLDQVVASLATGPALNAAVDPAPIATAMLSPDSSVTAQEFPGGLDALGIGLTQCRIEPTPPMPITWTPGDTESFGLALAAAARNQLKDFVIYNDRYTRLRYPMGDVHPMYGVCTDVIIRAYRALGLDLQELVQKTKSGSGDPNIDHRRVDTLRKFFSRFGESLPISTFAEDYKAGDIVTYWRPQNRHSRTHIAIVSDIIGPSGRPLIIHNRGWGPQQEDGLFVDEITGHYRFSGIAPATDAKGKGGPLSPTRLSRTKESKPASPVVPTGEPPSAPRS